MDSRYTYNSMREEHRRDLVLKYNVENFEELAKIFKEIKKLLKDKRVNFIDFEIKVNYFIKEWVDFNEKFKKIDKK